MRSLLLSVSTGLTAALSLSRSIAQVTLLYGTVSPFRLHKHNPKMRRVPPDTVCKQSFAYVPNKEMTYKYLPYPLHALREREREIDMERKKHG